MTITVTSKKGDLLVLTTPNWARYKRRWMIIELAITTALLITGLATQNSARGKIILLSAIWLVLSTWLYFRIYKPGKERLGLVWKNSDQTLGLLFPSLCLVAIVFLTGQAMEFFGVRDIEKDPRFPERQLGYVVGALFQQLLFHWYYYFRLEKLCVSAERASMWTAVAFCLAHLPNPLLMTQTFLAGWFFSWMFREHRNLYTLILCHGLLGASLSAFWPHWVMLVGKGFWKYVFN